MESFGTTTILLRCLLGFGCNAGFDLTRKRGSKKKAFEFMIIPEDKVVWALHKFRMGAFTESLLKLKNALRA